MHARDWTDEFDGSVLAGPCAKCGCWVECGEPCLCPEHGPRLFADDVESLVAAYVTSVRANLPADALFDSCDFSAFCGDPQVSAQIWAEAESELAKGLRSIYVIVEDCDCCGGTGESWVHDESLGISLVDDCCSGCGGARRTIEEPYGIVPRLVVGNADTKRGPRVICCECHNVVSHHDCGCPHCGCAFDLSATLRASLGEVA